MFWAFLFCLSIFLLLKIGFFSYNIFWVEFSLPQFTWVPPPSSPMWNHTHLCNGAFYERQRTWVQLLSTHMKVQHSHECQWPRSQGLETGSSQKLTASQPRHFEAWVSLGTLSQKIRQERTGDTQSTPHAWTWTYSHTHTHIPYSTQKLINYILKIKMDPTQQCSMHQKGLET